MDDIYESYVSKAGNTKESIREDIVPLDTTEDHLRLTAGQPFPDVSKPSVKMKTSIPSPFGAKFTPYEYGQVKQQLSVSNFTCVQFLARALLQSSSHDRVAGKTGLCVMNVGREPN